MPDASLHPSLMARDDDAQRLRALDVTRSFLVQAPAGSGKTELLIQRFLALLATVERPESILAMTFTRKAAGEMRERIINALRDAAAGVPVSDAHAQRTRALAQAALTRDGALGWHLVDHPARLRLMTIDALATGLAREAPLTTRTGAMPAFSEHPEALYHAAASEALTHAAAGDTAWRTLLDHLDNDGQRVVDLLAELLRKRDQWLRHLVGIDPDGLRAALEATLVEEIEARLAAAHALFPANALPRLAALARHALAHLTGEPASAQLVRALHACHEAGGIPGTTCDEMADWASLANWLLVKTPAWRKTVNQTQGFAPTGAAGKKAAERKARKREMLALLAELAQVPGLAEAMDAVRHLPPRRYAEATWEMIAALLTVLPRVAAALKVQFAAQRTIDFSEATELALLALGTPDAPSDVLLALDQRIGHLLIDEFQDTSLMQRDLVLRLTAGWVAGDGRTLFAVGDPMQSIYRFREAEVSLFLAAQSECRIGDVAVEPLTLSRNFRSQAGIVDWVNAVLPKVLPDADNPVRGAVAFKPSVASHPRRDGASPTVDLASTDHDEATRVVCRVRDALASQPRENVAILVRARTHLASILPALRAAG
ncbi:MAG: UvrD-helicase domain-containing protein, partial [Betaproteobacteria bacterium]